MDCIQEVREKLQDVIWFILRHMNKIFMFSTSFILNIQRVTRHLHPSPSLCQVHVFSSVPSEGRSDSSAWRPLCALWTTFIFQLRRRVHAPPHQPVSFSPTCSTCIPLEVFGGLAECDAEHLKLRPVTLKLIAAESVAIVRGINQDASTGSTGVYCARRPECDPGPRPPRGATEVKGHSPQSGRDAAAWNSPSPSSYHDQPMGLGRPSPPACGSRVAAASPSMHFKRIAQRWQRGLQKVKGGMCKNTRGRSQLRLPRSATRNPPVPGSQQAVRTHGRPPCFIPDDGQTPRVRITRSRIGPVTVTCSHVEGHRGHVSETDRGDLQHLHCRAGALV